MNSTHEVGTFGWAMATLDAQAIERQKAAEEHACEQARQEAMTEQERIQEQINAELARPPQDLAIEIVQLRERVEELETELSEVQGKLGAAARALSDDDWGW